MAWVESGDDKARARLEIVVSDDGLIMTHDGVRPLGSSGAAGEGGGGLEASGAGGGSGAETRAIFVMDRTGAILLTTDHDPRPAGLPRFSHASFVAGVPVIAAGGMRVCNGRIVSLDHESEDYAPPPSCLHYVWERLEHLGYEG